MGFNKEQVLVANANSNNDIRSKILAFKNEMRSNPQVLAVSTSQAVPGNGVNFNLFTIESKNGWVDKGVDCYAVDEDYFKTLGMKIVKGRNFTGLSDTLRSIIVNENMVKEFGWAENAMGKRIKFPDDTTGNYFEVVGVVKDFNQKSLYNPITPLILFYAPNNNSIQVKLNAANIPQTIAGIEGNGKQLSGTAFSIYIP
jgi:putative ABC transport system permease protein